MSTTTQDDVRQVVIVGSGPAGYTAAIYAARAELSPLVFESSVRAGGALMNTTDVENYPGFPAGVMGPELMEQLRAQAERFGAELVADDIVEMRLEGDVKELVTGSGETVRALAVIIATGSEYREIGLENEKRLSGRGVSWCATCDGFFFKEKDIVVVGGGATPPSRRPPSSPASPAASPWCTVATRSGPARSCNGVRSRTPRCVSGGTPRSSTCSARAASRVCACATR